MLLCALAPAVVHAGPLTVTAGLGVREATVKHADNYLYRAPFDDGAPALVLSAGYRVHRDVAVTAHVGISHVGYEVAEYRSMGETEHDYYDRVPFELGLGVQLEHGRLWGAPWLGIAGMRAGDDVGYSHHGDLQPVDAVNSLSPDWTAELGGGLTVGIDVVHSGEHRVAVYLDAQTSSTYEAFGIGIAYRR